MITTHLERLHFPQCIRPTKFKNILTSRITSPSATARLRPQIQSTPNMMTINSWTRTIQRTPPRNYWRSYNQFTFLTTLTRPLQHCLLLYTRLTPLSCSRIKRYGPGRRSIKSILLGDPDDEIPLAYLHQDVVIRQERRGTLVLSSRNATAHLPRKTKTLHPPRRRREISKLIAVDHHRPSQDINGRVLSSDETTMLDGEGTITPHLYIPWKAMMTSPAAYYQERLQRLGSQSTWKSHPR